MHALELIQKEHQKIEQYLLDLEEIMLTNPINYPALIHLFKTYFSFWDGHEDREEKIFIALEKEGFKVPVRKIQSDHGFLNKHKEAIHKAIESNSESNVKNALEIHGKRLMEEVMR